jgi:hypothetical protein
MGADLEGGCSKIQAGREIYTVDSVTQTCNADMQRRHPSAWWGACSKLKKEVKKRIEIWEIKMRDTLLFRPCPKEDEWLERAERVMKKLDLYWSRIVYSAGEIPRAICGRLRLKSGWKEEAFTAIFGKELTPGFFMNLPEYWKWRYKRDGCRRDEDTLANIEWMYEQSRLKIEVGV